MNSDLVPAVVAAGGGSAMIAGIWLHEHRRAVAMRASMVRLGVRFPANLELVQVLAVLGGLSGLPHSTELVVEVAASEGSIAHSVWVPEASRASVSAMLVSGIPSLRITEVESPPDDAATLGLRLSVPTPSLLADGDVVAASRSLLTGMAGLRGGERVVVRWCLRPGGPRVVAEPENPTRRQREIARGWLAKTVAPGFSASGLVLIGASRGRARELAAHIENVLRGRRGVVGGIRVRRAGAGRSFAWLPRVGRSSGWLSAVELAPLLGWPLGDGVIPGVEVGAARELLVPRQVARAGRRLLIGRDSGGERPVALSAEAAAHHMAVVGPSGVGKSVLLTHAILSDIERGFGGVVIDPKADLIQTVLERVKPEHAERIVVLDPGDARPVPGLAVLSGGDPDLRADVLTGTLKAIFGSAWGVRSDFYGRLGIRTLGELPGVTLADLGRLFYEEAFRRAAVARLRDPFLVSSWQGYEALSEAAKAEHVQAPMARVMSLLSRPRVRAVLASPEARLDVSRLLAERKWLLVSLAPGQLGEAGAAIVGGCLMYLVWSAIEARVVLSPERRHPVFVYVDELSTLTSGLPFSFELLAERARGLGAGLSVAIQTLGRVPEPTRSALLGNVASFISFRAPAEDAARLSRQFPGLSDTDLMGLARFEVAARVGTGTGSAVAVVTGRTEPLPPPTGLAASIRDASAVRYAARPPAADAVEVQAPPAEADAPLGAQRRCL